MSDTSLSGVGGALAGLLPIDNENWIVRCGDVAERDALLAYAASKSVPCKFTPAQYLPTELSIGWCIDTVLAYGGIPNLANTSASQFIAMCDAHAAR